MCRFRLAQLAVWLMAGAGLIGAPAWAQESAMLESFQPTGTALQSVMQADGAWANSRGSDPHEYDLEFTAMPGLELRRNFSESVVPHKGAILVSGIRRGLVDSLLLAIGPRTRLGFSREINNVRDLRQALLSGSEEKTLSLVQGFGSGHSGGTFEYKQIDAAKFTGSGDPDRLLSEVMALQSGLGKGFSVAAKLINTDSPDPFGLHQRTQEASLGLPVFGGTGKLGFSNFQERNGIHSKQIRKFDAAMPLALSGGEGKLGFASVNQVVDGQAKETRTWDVATPLAMFGGQANAVYQRISTEQNGQRSAQQTLDFSTPLDKLVAGASFSHKIQQIKQKKRPNREVRTSLLETPWQMLGANGNLTLQRATTRQSDQHTTDYYTKLVTQLEGQPLTVELQNLRTVGGGSHSKTQVLKVDIPQLSLLGDGTVEYDVNVMHKDGTKTSRPTMTLAMPLSFVDDQASLVHTINQIQRKKKPTQEARETVLALPIGILSATAQFKHSRKSLREPGDYRILNNSSLAVPMAGETLRLTRQSTHIPGKDGMARKRLTAAELPKFQLFTDKATITARHVIDAQTGRAGYHTTNVDVQVEPVRTVKTSANYCIRDRGASDSRDRQVFTSWHLSKSTSLNMLFHQLNDTDDTAAIVRSVYMNKQCSSGLGIQVGYASWGESGDDSDSAGHVQMSFGDPRKLNVSARLSEYDEKKWKPLDAPTLQMALQGGDPSKFSVKLEYEDAAQRLAPMRGVKLAFPALGGNLQIGAADCPVGRDGKTVQPASRYEASLKRSIFGSLNLAIGYRYWAYDEPWQNETTRQYLHFQLEGGREDRTGKLTVGFRSGDFVPDPQDKKKARPESLVDVNYACAFGDAGRITLGLHRPEFTSPGQKPEEFLEGQLEYGHLGISYKSGVVVPREKGQKVGPASVLSVRYEDRWSEEARLIISLDRVTPPENQTELTRSIEGRVEYARPF